MARIHDTPTMPHKEGRLTRADLALALGLGVVALLVYWRTLAPFLLPGDSGEFQTLAALLGSAHPTGYPLYLLFAKLFTILMPVDSIAYRVNLFSALAGGATVALLFLSVRLFGARRAAALLTALSLTFLPTFWSQALIAEVYTLGGVWFVALILSLQMWRFSRRGRYLLFAAVLGGSGMGVHGTILLLAPATLLYLALVEPNRREWISATAGTMGGVIALILAFLLVDAQNTPADFFEAAIYPSRSVWNLQAEDMDSPLERMFLSFGARQWRSAMFQPDRLPENSGALGGALQEEFGLFTLILLLIGIPIALRRNSRLALFLLVALFWTAVYVLSYRVWDLYVFFIPIYLLLFHFVAMGADLVLRLVRKTIARITAADSTAVDAAIVFVTLLLLAGAIGPSLMRHSDGLIAGEPPLFTFPGYPVASTDPEQLLLSSRALADELPTDALLAVGWSRLYPLYYVAHVEGRRADLRFIEEKPFGPDIEGNSLIEFVEETLGSRPLYFENCIDDLRSAGYTCRPERLAGFRLQRIE